MAHIIFIHGIANKPAKDALLDQWQVALFENGGVDLDQMRVTSSMVYWADLLYPEPLSAVEAASQEALEADGGVDAGEADMSWLLDVGPEEAAFVAAMAATIGMASVAATVSEAGDVISPNSDLEAIPLPDFMKARLMRVFLRDVHHYLYNATFSPRPGESYPIRTTIRQRTIEALTEGVSHDGPHVLLTHSLGTVIAYDVLTGLADAPPIDALVTIGSPLGLSDVQAKLSPPWTSYDGWPSQRLGNGSWLNVADRFDPVCGLDAAIAADFRRDGVARVVDVTVNNEGSWRHSVVKYLRQYAVRQALRSALTAPPGSATRSGAGE